MGSFLRGKYKLCVSNEILEEYEEILCRYITPSVAENVIEAIVNSRYTILQTAYYHYNLVRTDPDDNKFVDCAIAANAKYVVTNDAHFNVLRDVPHPRVEIINLIDFADELANS